MKNFWKISSQRISCFGVNCIHHKSRDILLKLTESEEETSTIGAVCFIFTLKRILFFPDIYWTTSVSVYSSTGCGVCMTLNISWVTPWLGSVAQTALKLTNSQSNCFKIIPAVKFASCDLACGNTVNLNHFLHFRTNSASMGKMSFW